jgi:MFS family permease
VARLTAPRALAPLRHRSFRLLAVGQVTSNVGDACYAVALPWYVLAGHGGAVLLGTVLVAYGVPRTALLAVGGYASDRWRPQTVMMATDAARTLAMAGLATVAALGPARAAVLIPIAVVLGAGEGLFLPGSFSIIPSLVPGDDLQAANAFSSSGTQLATLAGPVIGGALVAFGGTSLAFMLDAASFAVSAATLARLAALARGARPAHASAAEAEARPEGAGESGPTLRAFFRAEHVLYVILLVNVAANIGSGGMGDVALPALAHGPLRAGAGGYGAMLAAFGGGALLGTLAVGQTRRVRRPAVTGSLAFLAEAACMGVAPYLGSTYAVAAMLAGLGIANGFGNVMTITAFQQWAPPNLLGRLSGLLTLTSFGVFPVSVALAAACTRDLGPAPFFLFAAITLAVAVLAGLTQKSWRDFGMDRARASASTPPLPSASSGAERLLFASGGRAFAVVVFLSGQFPEHSERGCVRHYGAEEHGGAADDQGSSEAEGRSEEPAEECADRLHAVDEEPPGGVGAGERGGRDQDLPEGLLVHAKQCRPHTAQSLRDDQDDQRQREGTGRGRQHEAAGRRQEHPGDEDRARADPLRDPDCLERAEDPGPASGRDDHAHQGRCQAEPSDKVRHEDHSLHLPGKRADGGGQRRSADDLVAENCPGTFQDFGPQMTARPILDDGQPGGADPRLA